MQKLVVSESYLHHDPSVMVSGITLNARVQPLGIVMLCLFSLVPWSMGKKHVSVTRHGWCADVWEGLSPEPEEKSNLCT